MVLTGIELALAIIPLVMASTEYYRKAFEKSRTASRQKVKNEKLLDFYHNLHAEIALLNLTLRYLVSDLPTISEQKKEKLLEHDRNQWRDAAVAEALSNRLGGAEDAFTDILNTTLNTLENVISDKSLHLTGTDINHSGALYRKLQAFRPENFQRGTLDDLIDRLRFTSNEKTRAHALKRIEECNKKLERLLRPATPALYEVKRHLRRKGPPQNKCRRLTNELHSAITQHWWCTCENPHEARLCLLRGYSSSDSSSTVASLDMLISTKSDNQNRRAWQESNICILAEEEAHRSKATVRFQVNGESVQTTTIQNFQREMVESLCSLVKEPGASRLSLGIEFEGGKLWRARPRRRSLCVEEPELRVPLDSLLQGSAMKMSLKEKRVLAVVIAHAVLNFCESPWLDGDWDKRHISFYGHSTGDGGLDFRRPYLSTNFRDSTQAANDQAVFLTLHPSPAILALGILLLEIELSQPIESHWVEEDLADGEPNFNTNLTTAERLLEKSVDEIYESYRMAIEACLNCDFALLLDDRSLENERFRQQVYENIVAPLEDELWHGWKLTADELQAF